MNHPGSCHSFGKKYNCRGSKIHDLVDFGSYFSLIFIIRKMPQAKLGFEKEGGILVNVISRHLIPVQKLVLVLAHLVFCLFKPIKPPPTVAPKAM